VISLYWQNVTEAREFPGAENVRMLAASGALDETGDFDLGDPWRGAFDPLDDDPE